MAGATIQRGIESGPGSQPLIRVSASSSVSERRGRRYFSAPLSAVDCKRACADPVEVKVQRISPATATASVYNYASTAEFTAGYRYDARVPGGDNRFLQVMGLDGAVSSAAAAGATGVTVNVAGGGQVTVNFNRDTAGATVTINGATTTIGATVDVLAK